MRSDQNFTSFSNSITKFINKGPNFRVQSLVFNFSWLTINYNQISFLAALSRFMYKGWDWSETTAQDIYCSFPIWILCNCKLVSFVAMTINRQLKDIFQEKRQFNLVIVIFQFVFTLSSFVGNAVYTVNYCSVHKSLNF